MVLAAEPTHFNAATLVGRLHLRRGDGPGALTVLEAAAAEHRDYPPLLRALAEARLLTGDLAGAELMIGDALEKDPKAADGWVVAARVACAARKLSTCAQAATRARALGSRDPQIDALLRQSTP